MILDTYIAKILLKKKYSISFVKHLLRTLYILATIIIYLFIFSKINKTFSGIIIFLIVSVFFEIIRSRRLSEFLEKRNLNL